MGKLVIFGGTTEAREIFARLIANLNLNADDDNGVIYCAATEYGAEIVRKLIDNDAAGIAGNENIKIYASRLTADGMSNLFETENVTCIIDATHPYAAEVSKNIKEAISSLGRDIPLMRVSRDAAYSSSENGNLKINIVSSCAGAVNVLNTNNKKVLLTVGSKELREFISVNNYKERIFARVLPTSGVLKSCEDMGFSPSHIIAMQGPFTYDMNLAQIKSTGAEILITKDSGRTGGMYEKLDAARDLGIEVILIARPDANEEIHSIDDGVLWARRMLNLERPPMFPMLIDIEGRDVLVVGGGKIALRRVKTLLKCGACVRVVSPEINEGFYAEDVKNRIRIFERPFASEDLNYAMLAVAASDDRDVNKTVGIEARARDIPVSVADAAGECSFFFPSLIASGATSVSVSTAGMSPSMTKKLSDRLRNVWARWVAEESEEEPAQPNEPSLSAGADISPEGGDFASPFRGGVGEADGEVISQKRGSVLKKRKIRIGSRASALAVAQSNLVIDAITAAHPEIEAELIIMQTTGDMNMKPFADITDPSGIKGLFTLELENALLNGDIDLAIHSLKDVPMKLNDKLPIVAYSKRADPRDALIINEPSLSPDGDISPRGGDKGKNIIGCSSLRRRLQLAKIFPDKKVIAVRGNIQTRLKKLEAGEFDMLVLAAAGLERLGMGDKISRYFSVDEMIPSAGQGVLACQGRAEGLKNGEYYYLDAINDKDAADCVIAERAFASALGGGCTQPVAAHAIINDDDKLELTGLYVEMRDNGANIYHKHKSLGQRDDAETIGRNLAAQIMRGFK